jgi:hypothetical protein
MAVLAIGNLNHITQGTDVDAEPLEENFGAIVAHLQANVPTKPIQNADIATGAVTSGSIAAGAITHAHLGDAIVDTHNLAATVTASIDNIPVGATMIFATAPPAGEWAACGNYYSSGGVYQPLYNKIGTTYGSSGSTFYVPNVASYNYYYYSDHGHTSYNPLHFIDEDDNASHAIWYMKL